jgi:ATP-dependent DNA helicase RecG
VGDGARQAKIIGALPYKLTGGQTFANAEIQADMASPSRMLRLLQGDVGSGKTIVALLALANVVECGAQGTFMVPTRFWRGSTCVAHAALRGCGHFRCSSHGP